MVDEIRNPQNRKTLEPGTGNGPAENLPSDSFQGFFIPDNLMDRGWVKLWRKTLDSRIFQDSELLKLWIWCLLKANHKLNWCSVNTGRGQTQIQVNPGQFVFGRNSAAKQLQMKPTTIRKRILKLKSMGNCDIQSDTHYSIVTICNWDKYQNEFFEKEQPKGQPSDRQVTGKGQPSDTNKNDKNVKNEKNEKKKRIYSRDVQQVLDYLNEKKGSNYRDGSKIKDRLKDGNTIEECLKVIDNKFLDDYFISNPKYLNPETLFRKSNFDKYLNDVPDPLKSKFGENPSKSIKNLGEFLDEK